MQAALLIYVASVVKLFDMSLWIDVLLLLGAMFGFVVAAAVGVAYVFHLTVEKLDRNGAIVVNGEFFNTETNEWEAL